ncbi:MAG: hypothetical protein OXI13_14055 [Gammaproteobacteria bacterium]|nr:hypothetical protein [Gammaproteobacteria bacterium]MDE0480736.1 hypothetical protein [Gammaproteobacteria bacterium]MXX05526.1 hypothetical protein [Gammaproteobacteria bacterium]MYE30348.1 hypothetical protein [Gammaproteobacteria bacterium]MYI02982.1 hypothetical protein [Gammaproteobacteria bacterium]
MNEYELLKQDIELSNREYEKIIAGSAIRTRQMLEHHGEVKALSLLMESGDIQTGFRRLIQANKSQFTFEAIVIRHEELFRNDVVEAAKFRLENAENLGVG